VGCAEVEPSISNLPPDAAKALLYVGQPEQADVPPVPSHRPSPGQVPPLSMAGTGGGAFVVAVFEVAAAAVGCWSFAPMTDGAANGERLVVVVLGAEAAA
jgi:hypothetical protein